MWGQGPLSVGWNHPVFQWLSNSAWLDFPPTREQNVLLTRSGSFRLRCLAKASNHDDAQSDQSGSSFPAENQVRRSVSSDSSKMRMICSQVLVSTNSCLERASQVCSQQVPLASITLSTIARLACTAHPAIEVFSCTPLGARRSTSKVVTQFSIGGGMRNKRSPGIRRGRRRAQRAPCSEMNRTVGERSQEGR